MSMLLLYSLYFNKYNYVKYSIESGYRNLNESQILKSHLFKQKDAQPIVLKGYKKPMVETEIENLFWISTHHVYPHDRGIEYAIEEAEKLSTSIIRSDNNS